MGARCCTDSRKDDKIKEAAAWDDKPQSEAKPSHSAGANEETNADIITVNLDKRTGKALGLEIDDSDGIIIEDIEEGLVQDWNRVHGPELQVQRGDRILEVNGVLDEDTEGMFNELTSDKMLKIVLLHDPHWEPLARGKDEEDEETAPKPSGEEQVAAAQPSTAAAEAAGGEDLGFGTLLVRVAAAYSLRNTDSSVMGTDLSDPFTVIQVGEAKQKTETIKDNLNPVWTAPPMLFDVRAPDKEVQMDVFDENTFTAHDELGSTKMEFRQHAVKMPRYVESLGETDGEANGELEFEATMVCWSTGCQSLVIRVMRAFNLRNTDASVLNPSDRSDPYVVIRVGEIEAKTAVINDDLNPIWQTRDSSPASVFSLQANEEATVEFEVWDYNNFKSPDKLGDVSFSSKKFETIYTGEQRQSLGKGNGELEFELCFMPVFSS
mmetsp:Transcript_5950/g.13092  ORF Transcript_5950/g.13092 Transcript_5950/m.13092 type:complete len:436 (+) Transcript_5950:151-1458(+)|eukprot:CAMPEP_0178382060 /NCGR_PEP_ID=MMETSP0689_2-20121128/6302_1 /TAXON_ID=160604 /ORGANISM="Amphidinium massartii, Strain CS-259" /LENGTH=435 /DNA_ID=CAMNT_0020002259 /DNA_START=54 /DNA_END=1361 /DNA_ORIENTATION=+